MRPASSTPSRSHTGAQRALPAVLLAVLLTLGLWSAAPTLPAAYAAADEAQAADTHAGDDHSHDDGHGHGDDEAGSKSPLQFFPQEFVWNLIVFLLLLTVLGKFVWPKILAGLNAREAKLRDDMLAAETQSNEAAETLAQYKAQLADAQKEYQRIVDQAKTDAASAAAKVKADAEADLAAIKTRAEADIRSAKEQAVADIYEQAAVLSTDIAGKVLQREIRPEDHRALIDESLAKLN